MARPPVDILDHHGIHSVSGGSAERGHEMLAVLPSIGSLRSQTLSLALNRDLRQSSCDTPYYSAIGTRQQLELQYYTACFQHDLAILRT